MIDQAAIEDSLRSLRGGGMTDCWRLHSLGSDWFPGYHGHVGAGACCGIDGLMVTTSGRLYARVGGHAFYSRPRQWHFPTQPPRIALRQLDRVCQQIIEQAGYQYYHLETCYELRVDYEIRIDEVGAEPDETAQMIAAEASKALHNFIATCSRVGSEIMGVHVAALKAMRPTEEVRRIDD